MCSFSLSSLQQTAHPQDPVLSSSPRTPSRRRDDIAQPLHPSEAALSAVLRIEVSHRHPNAIQPWRQTSTARSVGTAFAISPRLVLTAAVNVINATYVALRRTGHDLPFAASVSAVSYEADIAVLAVDDDAFWHGVQPLELACAAPPLQRSVALLAFSDETDSATVATGALLRLTMDTLDDSVGECLIAKADLPKCSGARGAPVVDADDCVVGMLVRPSRYLVAVNTLARFVNEFRATGKLLPVPHMGFEWQETVNPSLRRFLRMKPEQSGVYVRTVPQGSSAEVLRVGDVVTALDGVAVSSRGTVTLRGNEKVSLTYVTSQLCAGDILHVNLIRDGTPMSVSYRLEGHEKVTPIRFRNFERAPSYVTIGGLVFTTLSEQFLLGAFGPGWPKATPLELLSFFEKGILGHVQPETTDERKEVKGQSRSIVLLTQILTSPMTETYERCISEPSVLVRFNGHVVQSLHDLARKLHTCTDESFVLDFGEEVIVLDRQESWSESPRIMSQHGIRHAARIGGVAGDISLVANEGFADSDLF